MATVFRKMYDSIHGISVVDASSIFRGLVFIKLTDPFVIYHFNIRGDNSILPRSFCLQYGECVQ